MGAGQPSSHFVATVCSMLAQSAAIFLHIVCSQSVPLTTSLCSNWNESVRPAQHFNGLECVLTEDGICAAQKASLIELLSTLGFNVCTHERRLHTSTDSVLTVCTLLECSCMKDRVRLSCALSLLSASCVRLGNQSLSVASCHLYRR